MALDGAVCIVTGGGSGIGEATALLMAREGAKVVVAGRTESKVEAVRREIEARGGTARAYALNVADHDAVHAMAAEVKDAYGRIDVLVNCAGHSSPNRRVLTTTPKELRGVMDSNLVGTVFCTQAVLPTMLEAKVGTIINVASLAGVNPGLLGGMAYCAAKAAVINFTHFINAEFNNTDIRASVVIPGEVNTPVLAKRPVPPSEEARATMVGAEDVARAIVLIANLPRQSAVPELVIRPTVLRDTSKETAAF